ncbi:hypothetical protein A3H40_04270 [Candidatus Daviesbacteria bacterium RIFCSPLOWO2_02_FULL_38_15]|uniref:Gcp-like domain-containing protein n=1 Tax=Candidatus Daviesbacteria bacterium RIFCSPLOWO2_02_FULL_38_15 TaxID=1797794 RepID=A0A1F5N4F6_9BACT|nr:MAG: hypothetical protein A3H40_04270 [Candidatus Daviesbacteria bacterium RIFCSPLOWO2_02_FULL_38_15]
MILHLDTKDQKVVRVSLKDNGRVVKRLSEENEYGSQVLLPLIDKLIRMVTPGVDVQNWGILEAIEIETGPGSFTGLRVGVSVANALGFSLRIPVNGKKMETNLSY